MNPKWRLWLAGGLAAAVIGAAIYFPALRRQVYKVKDLSEQTAEQARRELLPPAPVNSGEPRVKAQMYWGSRANDGTLVPVTVELPLSSDPTLRAKEILNTLLAGPVDPEARTLPPDAALLAFYILPDGTGVADFSEALASSIPSGIQSEQLAVDSIARTLEANVPQVQRLRILIHGQEVDTLAGHLDLTQTFQVSMSNAGTAPAKSGVSVLTAPIQKAYDKVKRATKRQ
ncbi:MAG TPA: GerMN domain-containing protein [Verrucomicrobiae bacterium]|jgi:Sporulation and spore germination|nr:GerMN domain-containing protein [Verrucomicrobiae bacterium]